MDIKGFPALIVGVVVALVLAGATLPIWADTLATEDTFKNEGVFYYGVFKPTDTYTLTYNNTTGALTVNGETVTVPGVDSTHYGAYSILASDDWLFRYGSNQSGYYEQVVGKDKGGNTVLSGGNCTATITGGDLVATFTDSENNVTTKTLAFTEFYGIVPTEDNAIMKISNQSVYIKGDSPLYGSGLTTVSAWNNAFHFEGTYDDGITISSPNLTGVTFDNITWNIEPVDSHEDLYKLTSIEFDINYNDTTVHATYSYFGVPSEVTADRSVSMSGPLGVLVGVLPLLIVAGLVTGAVVWFINRKG